MYLYLDAFPLPHTVMMTDLFFRKPHDGFVQVPEVSFVLRKFCVDAVEYK